MSGRLITIRPGPTLCVWDNGTLITEVPLSFHTTLELVRRLLAALPRSPE